MNATLARLRRRRRGGLTLMEILLVLALLVAISAISLPALKGPMENQRLRASGDIVRVEWSRARVKAMESGRTYVFRHQPELGTFKIEPWYMEDDYLESSDVNTGMGGGAAGGINGLQVNEALSSGGLVNPTSTTATSTTELGELPEGVVFVGSESEMDDRSAFITLTTADAGEEALWSPPIFFYPDGTSSTSRILIRNGRGRYVMVSVRGLTGVVQVSDLLTVEEIQ